MAEKRRFFVTEINGDVALIQGEELSHARTVLRLDVGSEIILLDNSGKEYDAIVESMSKKEMTAHVISSKMGEKEAKTDVTLLFGFLKNADKNEFVVQKATELGVNKIVLFSSAFSSAYMNENKLERLRKIAQESAKQCLRSRAPSIEYCDGFEEALKRGREAENKLFACEFIEKSQTSLDTLSGSTVVVIGSEGGFSRKEFDLAQSLGYKGVTLGKRILRAETAAVALLSVVTYSLGEWSVE